jgi:hypothetical protein
MASKTPISIRIDNDVLEWFKAAQTKGYQSLIQRVLKEHVEREKSKQLILLGRAQELYRRFHTQCFWHLRPDLPITPERIPLVAKGLRTYGGQEGYTLAEELCP